MCERSKKPEIKSIKTNRRKIMFTKNNRQLQSTAKAEINDGNQNNRKASVFINKLFARGRAFAFVAAVAFSFFAMSADSAQAQQQNNYWANDGCFYTHDGRQWARLCPADQSRTKYYFDMIVNSQWLRFFYMDNTLYSDNGNTFKQTYLYAQKTWTRTYSNGASYIYSQSGWTSLSPPAQQGRIIIEGPNYPLGYGSHAQAIMAMSPPGNGGNGSSSFDRTPPIDYCTYKDYYRAYRPGC